MTAYQSGDRMSVTAAVALTGKRYQLVKLDAAGKLVLASAATDAILGVLDNEPALGQTADVVLANGAGTFKVRLAANTAAGALLGADSAGKAVVVSTTGNRVFGRLIRAGLAGEIAEYIKLNEKI